MEVVVLDLPQKFLKLAVLGLDLLGRKSILVLSGLQVALPIELILRMEDLPFGKVKVLVRAFDRVIGVQIKAHFSILCQVLILEVYAVPSACFCCSFDFILRLDFILKNNLPGPLLEPPQFTIQQL